MAEAEATGRRHFRLAPSRRSGNIFFGLVLLVLAYFFIVRGVRFFEVPSSSMEPTLYPGDRALTINQPSYVRGDIVVLRDPQGGYMVKRVAGIGGDEVAVLDGALFINGEFASEPYIQEPMEYLMQPTQVPDGKVLILGDNRNHSEDSSLTHQTYPVDDIIGRLLGIYYPYDRLGMVESYPVATVPLK